MKRMEFVGFGQRRTDFLAAAEKSQLLTDAFDDICGRVLKFYVCESWLTQSKGHDVSCPYKKCPASNKRRRRRIEEEVWQRQRLRVCTRILLMGSG